MKKLTLILIALVLGPSGLAAEPAKKLRIGWQVPWTLQGQLVQVLQKTDILSKHGIEAEFIGRTYGPELNELALAGAVDVILTADQPAANLFAKSEDWRGIGRLMYNRTSTYVPPLSNIRTLSDLKGKNIGLPFGAAAERVTHAALAEAGVSRKDLRFTNLGMLEHAPLVQRAGKKAKKWDQFDALAGFDPIPALLEAKGLVRAVHAGKVCALILMKSPDEKTAKGLLRAFRDAYAYYRKNHAKVNEWYRKAARFKDLDAKAIELTESFEPNLKSGAIRLRFTEDDFRLMQKGADFAGKATGRGVSMRDHVTNQYADAL
jgi:ABC-type nitrate/sulfonate/bicarbonate transport system substrate-binding protein